MVSKRKKYWRRKLIVFKKKYSILYKQHKNEINKWFVLRKILPRADCNDNRKNLAAFWILINVVRWRLLFISDLLKYFVKAVRMKFRIIKNIIHQKRACKWFKFWVQRKSSFDFLKIRMEMFQINSFTILQLIALNKI